MDNAQLFRLYQQETMYHTNPPMFETWLKARARKEAYYEQQERIASSPPDEDKWNRNSQ